MKKIFLTIIAVFGITTSTIQAKDLVAFFSAQGHTQAVAERIAELTGADIYRIEAADPPPIHMMTATVSKTRHTMTSVPLWQILPRRNGSISMTESSSARPAGGISPRWWYVRSSKTMT